MTSNELNEMQLEQVVAGLSKPNGQTDTSKKSPGTQPKGWDVTKNMAK
jgi:hypothetical protein